MGAALPAARVGDSFGHSSAMTGVLVGLAIGALVGVAIVATGGLGAIAIGAAIATTGGAGLAGQAIGETIDGPDTGVIGIGSPSVFINKRPATMTVIATGICSQDSGPPRKVATGAASVFVNGQPMGRISEKMDCSAVIRKGSADVAVGGPSKEVIKPEPEVPTWLSNTMTAMAIGGTIIATGGIALTYGTGAAVGSLVGGVGGGYLGGKGATMAAAAMGYGATGQAVAGVIGGLAGGALGGGLGFKGGQWGEAALTTPKIAAPPGDSGFPYSPKKIGQTEAGAVPNNAALQAEMDAAPFASAKSSPGHPDLPADKAATFGDDVRPWNGDNHPGTIKRVIGSDRDANGGYWQSEIPATEGEWRGGSAVLNDWNGNGGYVESPPTGLRGWIGSARPQMSSDGVNVLPGHGEQIWMPPGSANPGPPQVTPWSVK
jgi:hypothetical protein